MYLLDPSEPLNNSGLNGPGPHILGFFSINTVGPSYLRVLDPQIQPNADRNVIFAFPNADSQLQIKNILFDMCLVEFPHVKGQVCS